MDTSSLIFALIGVFGVILAVAILFTIRKRHHDSSLTAHLLRTTEELTRSQSEINGRMETLASNITASQSLLNRNLQDRLDSISNRMGQNLQETAAKTAKGIGALQTRLNVIDRAQKNITELSSQVVSLQDILSNKQARGAFGQIQLNDLVISALPPSAYEFESTLSNRRRVDCLIMLPNPPGPIGVDAKFPLEGYQALLAAPDELTRKSARRSFASNLLKHISDVADKYIIPGETAESALMFIPSEAVYAELHTNFMDVLDSSYAAKVWIVSPTTLMATLHTVRAILKDVRMREQAHLVQREVGILLQDVARLHKRTHNLEAHLNRTHDDVREILISSEKVLRRGQSIEQVQVERVSDENSISIGTNEKNIHKNEKNRAHTKDHSNVVGLDFPKSDHDE